jgi:hypothetical protein
MATTVARFGTDRQSNSGTATITSAATTVTVTHGLTSTPTHVFVTPRALGTAVKWWVSARDPSGFTITLNAAPGSNVDLDWFAAVNPVTGSGV